MSEYNKKKQTYRYREHSSDYPRSGECPGEGKMGKGDQLYSDERK